MTISSTASFLHSFLGMRGGTPQPQPWGTVWTEWTVWTQGKISRETQLKLPAPSHKLLFLLRLKNWNCTTSFRVQVALAAHHVFPWDMAWTFLFHFHAIDCSHLSVTSTFLLPELHQILFSPLGQSPEFVLILIQLFKALKSIPSSVCKFNKHILDSIIQAKTRNLLDKFFQLNSELLSSSLAMVFQAVSYLFHNIWETSSSLHCGL